MDETVSNFDERKDEQRIVQTAVKVPSATTVQDSNLGLYQISAGMAENDANVEPPDRMHSPSTTTTSTLPELQVDTSPEPSINAAFDESLPVALSESSSIPATEPEKSALRAQKIATIAEEVKDASAAGSIETETMPEGNMQKKEHEEVTVKSIPATPPVTSKERNAVTEQSKDENGFVFYKCRFCGLTYNYLTTLRAHERVHNIDEPYKCNRCSETFHFMCELEYHAKQHSDLKGYKCECGRTFHTYTDLLYHKHPDEEADETVVASAPTFVSKSAPRIPENEFPVPQFIEKGFEPKHPLRVYSDVRLNPYICQYCSKSYPNSRMLAYHMYGHRGEKIFNPRSSRYLMARSENSYISPGV